MAKEIEIEKKYVVIKLPQNLDRFEHKTIEQSYLNKGGSPIRIRKFIKENKESYIFSKKVKITEDSFEFVEHNIDLPKEIYYQLLEAKEGRTIIKTRYNIPLSDGLHVDLDLFHDFFEGVCVAEIEFLSVEQANNYKLPDWLGEDVTNSKKLVNYYMANSANEIDEYFEYIPKELNV